MCSPGVLFRHLYSVACRCCHRSFGCYIPSPSPPHVSELQDRSLWSSKGTFNIVSVVSNILTILWLSSHTCRWETKLSRTMLTHTSLLLPTSTTRKILFRSFQVVFSASAIPRVKSTLVTPMHGSLVQVRITRPLRCPSLLNERILHPHMLNLQFLLLLCGFSSTSF